MGARDEPKMDPRDEPLAPKTLALLLHAEHARHPSCGTAPLPAFPAELRPRIWSQLLELHGVRALPPPRAARGTEHAGIVASRWAEVGEWAAPGAPLVELLSLDRAEVRVSIPDTALEVVDLPFAGAAGQAPPARVTAALGADGATGWTWEGRLTRMEGRMDPATRFFAGVVEVAAGGPGAPPLVAGLFVGVEIEGRLFRGVGAVPRSAFREDGRVLVVDGEDRIRIRAVDAFWSEGEDEILVRSGLADGDRVVVRPPAVVAEGMAVRVASGGGPRP